MLLSPFSRSGLTYGVDLQELRLHLSHPRSAFSCFRESPNGESPGGSRESLSLSLPELHGALVALFVPQSHGLCLSHMLRGHLSRSDTTVGTVGLFCALVTWRDHCDKEDAFLSAGDSQYPHLWHIG